MTNYHAFIERKRREYGDKFSDIDLDKRFAQYFNTGQRIKIQTCGLTLTGTVRVTTGWKPIFILILTRRSMGSPWTLGHNEQILAVQHGKRYVPYTGQAAWTLESI